MQATSSKEIPQQSLIKPNSSLVGLKSPRQQQSEKLEFFIQNRGHDSPGRIQSAFQSASRQNRANALKKS